MNTAMAMMTLLMKPPGEAGPARPSHSASRPKIRHSTKCGFAGRAETPATLAAEQASTRSQRRRHSAAMLHSDARNRPHIFSARSNVLFQLPDPHSTRHADDIDRERDVPLPRGTDRLGKDPLEDLRDRRTERGSNDVRDEECDDERNDQQGN